MATGSPHCGTQSVPLCPWPLHLVSFPPSLLVRVDRSGRPVAAPAFPQRRSLPRGGRRIRLLLRGKLQERSKHSDRAPAYRGRKSEVGVPAVAVAEARCGCTSLPSECSEAGICLQGKKKPFFLLSFLRIHWVEAQVCSGVCLWRGGAWGGLYMAAPGGGQVLVVVPAELYLSPAKIMCIKQM